MNVLQTLTYNNFVSFDNFYFCYISQNKNDEFDQISIFDKNFVIEWVMMRVPRVEISIFIKL